MQYAVPFIWKISKSIFRVNSICRFWSPLGVLYFFYYYYLFIEVLIMDVCT